MFTNALRKTPKRVARRVCAARNPFANSSGPTNRDGLELVEDIKLKHLGIPVVLMTAHGSEEIALEALKVGAANAGLPDTGLHTLRHSAASVMLTHGVPLKVVSDILGHSSIAITGDIYGHVSPDVARDAIDMLGDAFDQ